MTTRVAHKKGLRKKIIFSLLIVGFVPVLVGLVVTYWNGTLRLRESMGANFQGLATEAARKTDLVIEREIEGKRHLSITSEIRSALDAANRRYRHLSDQQINDALAQRTRRWDSDQDRAFKQDLLLTTASSHLRNYMTTNGVKYIAFFVTDDKGAVVASVNGFPGYLHGQERWWTEAYNDGLGKIFIGDLYFNETARAYAVNIAVPVMDERTQKAIGVLAVVHDIRELLQVPIHSIRFGQTGHAMLIDSRGMVITCPVMPSGSFLTDQSLVAHVTSSTPSWVIARDDGHGGSGSIIGFAPAPETSKITKYSTGKQWHSFIRQDPKELYAPINSLLMSVSVSGVALIGFVALMGVVVSKKLANPIQILHEGAEEIGRGNLDVRLDIRTNDEIEQLATEFNRMAEQLKESYSTLEQRVTERTKQLSALNTIATTTTRSLDLQEILENTLNKVVDVMQFQAGAIWLWEGQDPHLSLRVSCGLPSDITTRYRDLRPGEMIAGHVAASGHPMIIEHTEQGPQLNDPLMAMGFVSLVAIPLKSKEKVLGALSGGSRVPRSYTPQDLDLLGSIGHQLSMSIENATLYTETRAMVERLQEADRFKSEFLSNISHELRTPLTSIIGYSEVLLERIAGELTANQHEYITNIQSSGTLLLEIINNLLDLSRIRAGKMEIHFGEFSMGNLITNCFKSVSPLASKKAQRLDYIADERPLMIQADEIKVKQIVLNLLSNAIKFTPHGGSIVVESRSAVLDAQPAIEVSVTDTGVGIKEDDLGKIFEEFIQADSSYTREYPGSGLGLPIVKQFVEMHGGHVTVQSQPGAGSRFTFVLPQRIEPEAHPEETAGPALVDGVGIDAVELIDPMTGLPNERYLRTWLDQPAEQGAVNRRTGTLLVTRLDRFAAYNDSQGRAAADRLIAEVAKTFRTHVRKPDVVCRCYGSTFAVVLADVGHESATAVGRKLQNLVATRSVSMRRHAASDSVTLSIAVVVLNSETAAAEDVLRHARVALDDAERQGGTRIMTI